MRGLTPQNELATQLQVARERVLEAVAGLTEEQASAPSDDGWSIKDHLTHLTIWHEMRFFEISRIARGGEAGFPTSSEERINPINDLIAENRRSLSLGQVVADLEFAWEMVAQAIVASPEDRLADRHFAELGATGGGHDIAHAEEIAARRKMEGI